MPRPIRWLLLAVLFGSGCFTSSDPLYCQRNADCPSSRPVCDLAGTMAGSGGIGQTCVAGGTCTANSECSDIAPICGDDGRCSPCQAQGGDSACMSLGTGADICSDTGACVECARSSDCGDAARPICQEGVCVSCTAADATSCSDKDTAAPICVADGATRGQCVECAEASDCTDAARPLCSAAGQCVACTEHSECATGVCDRTGGGCVASEAIIYVDPTGSDTGTCGTSPGSPCQTIAYAIGLVTSDRSWIKLSEGTFASTSGNRVQVVGGETVHLIGTATGGGSVIDSDNGSATVKIDNGSDVSIEDAVIQGGTDGITCGTTASTLDLWRVEILGNSAIGVVSSNCKVQLRSSELHGNLGGGLSVQEGSLAAANNFIYDNGKESPGASSQGGVRLAGAVDIEGFDFNTVVYNHKGSTGADGTGVECSQSTVFTLSNNIVWGNQKEGETADDEVDGNCTWAYSDIEQTVSGTTNLAIDPMFEDTGTGDYHLKAGSPLEGKASPDATEVVDIDGDSRPQGSGRDMGADEI